MWSKLDNAFASRSQGNCRIARQAKFIQSRNCQNALCNPLRASTPSDTAHWTRRTLLQVAQLLLLGRPAIAKDKKKETYDSAAETYNDLDGGKAADVLGFSGLRKRLANKAAGNVLEVAVGTGLNLPLYKDSQIKAYTGIDLSPGMLGKARSRLQALPMKQHASLLEGNVEALPFEDEQFDTVVSTFSLCVFDHPVAALKEMARVVSPKGRILLLEHSKSFIQPLGWYQDLTAEVVAATSKGCYWNQDLPALYTRANLEATFSEASLGGLVTLAELRRLS